MIVQQFLSGDRPDHPFRRALSPESTAKPHFSPPSSPPRAPAALLRSMTTFSKGPLQQFVKGTPYDTHRDQLHQPQASTSSSSSFRQQSSSTSTSTAEDEFGSFSSQPIDYTYSYQPLLDGRSYVGRESLAEEGLTRGESQDGAEINALLGGSTSLHDQVDGEWESELFASHQKNHEQDSLLPLDPLLPSQQPAHDFKGKGKETHQSGDLSPTSTNLLSSLSSLDLSTLAYLRNILSLPPDQAIQRYFETTESYTEDVWGVTKRLPREVKEVFEGAKGMREEENGREKAVRRLGMLIKQLKLDDPTAKTMIAGSTREMTVGRGARERGLEGERIESKSQAELDREEWAKEWAEYPIAAAHVRSPPKEHFKVSRRFLRRRVFERFD